MLPVNLTGISGSAAILPDHHELIKNNRNIAKISIHSSRSIYGLIKIWKRKLPRGLLATAECVRSYVSR